MLSRFAAGLCAAALAALIGAPTPTLAQDKTFELKLSHWVPPSHPLQKALEEWGASVEKESGGTFNTPRMAVRSPSLISRALSFQ